MTVWLSGYEENSSKVTVFVCGIGIINRRIIQNRERVMRDFGLILDDSCEEKSKMLDKYVLVWREGVASYKTGYVDGGV